MFQTTSFRANRSFTKYVAVLIVGLLILGTPGLALANALDGANAVARAHPQLHQAQPDVTAGFTGYTPQVLHKAYNLPWYAPRNQTIAIVDAYWFPNVKARLDTFNTKNGLGFFPSCSVNVTTACFQQVNQSGGAQRFANPNIGAAKLLSWEQETDLDVQAAHSICLNCKILLVSVQTSFETGVNTAARLGATQISNSYGTDESDLTTADFKPAAYNHPGIAIVVSAGDNGAGAAYPADLNTVVAVGGTSLYTNSDGSYNSERVWGNGVNAPNGDGTGSGCSGVTGSAYTSAAYWQNSVKYWAYTGCGKQRSIADVAAVADPNTGFQIYTNLGGRVGYGIWGGTSLSAPIIAGVFALAADAGSYKWPAERLYSHTNQLHDVTKGANGSCYWTISCTAWSGYDGPTGVGTPWGIGAF